MPRSSPSRQPASAPATRTLFVTLEPCANYGRTPPCVDAILAAGIARVVVGAPDPNPKTDGQGFARLREGGVEVELLEGDQAALARRQNEAWREVDLR